MFPITISFTINNAGELAKLEALSNVATLAAPAVQEKPAAPKSEKQSSKPSPASPTTQPAAAPAASEGNAAATEAPSPTASTASSSEASASPAVSFDVLKKAFLALSTKEGGRAKCEAVLKPFGLTKLSEAKEDQYGALHAAIQTASA